MARVSTVSAALGPCVAVAVALGLTACSADNPVHRSFRPVVVTASGVPYNGNGVAEMDPQAIIAAAVHATSSAPTVHMTGSLTGVSVPQTQDASESDDESIPSLQPLQSQASYAPGTFTLDMVFTQFAAVGDITAGSVTSRLLRIEDEVWAAEPASFWKAAGAAQGGKAYGGLYVQIPQNDPRYSGFTDDTRVGFLLDRLLQTSATWTKGAVTTIDGQQAVELDGTGTGGHRCTVWVATSGDPYLLRIAPAGGSFGGSLTFTGYDQRLSVQAPLPGQVLNNALVVLPSIAPTAPVSSSAPAESPSSTPSASQSPSATPTSSSATGGRPSFSPPSFSFSPHSSSRN